MRKILISIAALCIAPFAHAQNCTWTTVPSNINFGNYTVFGSAVTGNSAFGFNCDSNGMTGRVTLSTGGAGTYTRTLAKAAPVATLRYNLYRDAAGLIVWGDGTSGTQYLSFNTGSGQGQGGNQDFTGTIYGIIPAGLDAPAGTYTDTVQATLNWGTGAASRFFTVTATILADCNVSTSPLNFGNYDPVVANAAIALDNTTLVNVYCTKGTPVSVSLDNGQWVTGTTRRLKSAAANFLTYEMYKDAGRTVVWNAVNTNGGTSASKLTAINNGFSVYGRVIAGQDIPAGSYNDTVTVTVNY